MAAVSLICSNIELRSGEVCACFKTEAGGGVFAQVLRELFALPFDPAHYFRRCIGGEFCAGPRPWLRVRRGAIIPRRR